MVITKALSLRKFLDTFPLDSEERRWATTKNELLYLVGPCHLADIVGAVHPKTILWMDNDGTSSCSLVMRSDWRVSPTISDLTMEVRAHQ